MKSENEILDAFSQERPITLSSGQLKNLASTLIAFTVGVAIWHMPVPASLDESAWRFLASLAAVIILWTFETLDDYIVALILLFCWLTTIKLPTEIALFGFASSEWFFALAALSMAAAVTKVGLMRRVALSLLKRIPPSFTLYNSVLAFVGLLMTPVLPNVKGRMAIAAPVTQAISESLEYRPRSNASASLALSTYVGFSQLSFMFLTGMSSNLIGWNLMPQAAREQFGWSVWTLAALPAGLFTLLFLVSAIRFLFPPKDLE